MTIEFAESSMWENEYAIVIERRGIPLTVYLTKSEAKKLFKKMKEAGL